MLHPSSNYSLNYKYLRASTIYYVKLGYLKCLEARSAWLSPSLLSLAPRGEGKPQTWRSVGWLELDKAPWASHLYRYAWRWKVEHKSGKMQRFRFPRFAGSKGTTSSDHVTGVRQALWSMSHESTLAAWAATCSTRVTVGHFLITVSLRHTTLTTLKKNASMYGFQSVPYLL